MASQITHIVVADKLFEQYFPGHNRREFYIGTVFPDIRYLGEVERQVTHSGVATFIEIITESNSFQAGLKLHCLFDIVREKFLHGRGIYDRYPDDRVTWAAVKLFEDEYFYSQINNWSEICTYFDTVLDEERKWGVSEEGIRKWHAGVADYMSNPPSELSREKYGKLLGAPEKMWSEVLNRLDSIKKDHAVKADEDVLIDSLHLLLN